MALPIAPVRQEEAPEVVNGFDPARNGEFGVSVRIHRGVTDWGPTYSAKIEVFGADQQPI